MILLILRHHNWIESGKSAIVSRIGPIKRSRGVVRASVLLEGCSEANVSFKDVIRIVKNLIIWIHYDDFWYLALVILIFNLIVYDQLLKV